MKRPEQLAHTLRDVVGAALSQALEFPRGTIVTVTRAQVAPNARSATLYVSAFPEERVQEALAAIEEHRAELQRIVNEGTGRHPAPRIRFVADPEPLARDRAASAGDTRSGEGA